MSKLFRTDEQQPETPGPRMWLGDLEITTPPDSVPWPVPTPLTPPEAALWLPAVGSWWCCADGTCDHPAPPPPTWRTRVRRRLAAWWDRRPRIHLGPCNHEDCW